MQLWEQILLGAVAILLLVFLMPGLKQTLEKSRQAEKDWPGLLIPIAVVIGLILLVKSLL